ncbi:hypothetical protein [Lacrimispora brassicae]
MKKKFIVIWIYVLISLCGCSNIPKEQLLIANHSFEQTSEKDFFVQNKYFFPDESSITYKTRFTFLEEEPLPQEVDLLINEILRFKHGILYELKVNYDGEFSGRIYYDWDRFHLGYFYVQEDKIFLLRGENILNEITSEEDIFSMGKIVCQDEELKDSLNEDQKGEHEYISVNENQRQYHSYNNLVESGFYETFVWEQDIGLVGYRSGFGAEKDSIELYLESKN